MYTLLLRLAAPLQSWGSGSMFDTRETDFYPSKSAVIGILAAAMGIERDGSLEQFHKLKFGVRIDHHGERLSDLQITDMGEKLNSNLSHKVYLSDAVFLAGLESESNEVLLEIAEAIRHPVFPLYLGRRSCPPTLPILLGIRDLPLYEALYEEPWLLAEWRRKNELRFNHTVRLRILVENETDGALVRDEPVSFSPFKREYRYRRIKEMSPKTIIINDVLKTSHNPMKELG